MEIHPTAFISPQAELASGVQIGPYSIIGDHVSIGNDTVIGSHVVIEGHTKIGERNRIHPFVLIGSPPQDIGYDGIVTVPCSYLPVVGLAVLETGHAV